MPRNGKGRAEITKKYLEAIVPLRLRNSRAPLWAKTPLAIVPKLQNSPPASIFLINFSYLFAYVKNYSYLCSRKGFEL